EGPCHEAQPTALSQTSRHRIRQHLRRHLSLQRDDELAVGAHHLAHTALFHALHHGDFDEAIEAHQVDEQGGHGAAGDETCFQFLLIQQVAFHHVGGKREERQITNYLVPSRNGG